MAYDPAAGDMVLFGGDGSTGVALSDTWIFNGTTWTQLSSATSPPARYQPSMAYDPATGNVVLFGGGGSGGSGYLGDTWIFNGTTWTQLSPATSPSARYGASMAYDPATGSMVLFGGHAASGFLSDTWTFNGTTWTQLSPATSPPALAGASMAYDPATGDMVLFGGCCNVSDTWIFNGTTWTQLSPATSPPARDQAPMAYNPATGDMVLFGGYGNSGYLSDTWTFDGTTWTQLSPATSPSSRCGAMAYDPATGDMVLFGGYGNSGYLSDTWTFAQMIEVPGAPTKVKGTPGNAEVTVGWTPPSDNGSPIDTYTASVVGDSSEFCTYTVATDSGDDCVITGLTNGDSYQFQVTAHNAAGDGPASTASSSVTPAPVPGAPTIGTAKAGNASATLTWTAPSSNRGSAIIGYVVTPYIGITAQTTQTFTSTATTETATGLTNRTAYTFRVAAFNTVGTGTNSAASNSVTPTKATSKIVLRLSTTKVTYGHEQVLHLSVTVSPEFAGSTPTGTVPVKDSTTTLCVIKLSSGKGSCRLSLKVGTYRLVATYGGSTNFKSSTSAKETLTVTKATSKTTLKLAATKVTYGHEQVLHLSVTVSPEFAGSTPTGTVPVKDSTTTLCVIKLSSGKGSCRLSLKVGTYRLVATYGGSTNFKSSTSAKETLTVTKTAARTTQSPSGPSGPTSCIGETSKCAVAFPAVDDFGLSVLLVGKVIENTPCPDRGVCDQPAGDQLDTVLVGMGTRPGMTDPGIEMPNFSLILAGGGKGRIDSITCDKSVEYALCGLGAEAPNTSFVGVIVFDVPIGSTWQSVDFAYHSGSTSKVYVFTK
jgi:hypothetical protein